MSQNSHLDSVIEKLQRYCDYLERQVKQNKKVGSGQNGIVQNHTTDDADLELGCPNNDT